MKAILFFAGFVSGITVFSQEMILHDPVSGKTFNSEKYSGIKGSPFLYENWISGSVTVAKGTYKKLELKFDAYSNKIYFNKNDELYEFEDDVISFVLMPKVSDSSTYQYFKSGFSGDGLRSSQFVEVLIEGKISLYKSAIKLVTDVNEINRGVIKTFGDATRYFIMNDNKLKAIKMTKNDVLELVSDKQEKIQAYIDQNKLSTKKSDDLLQILKYYNSL